MTPALDDLVARARTLASPQGRRAILGICGSPGAGKSTFAEALLERLAAPPPDGFGRDGVAHVPLDGFHLADAQLARLGLTRRKGAPETFDAHGYVALLQRVRSETEQPVYAPGFERDLEQPIAAALVVPPAARLVVTEGNYLLLDDDPWPGARDLLDEVWYVDVDPRLRLERLIARHIAFGKTPEEAREWVQRSDEANARLVERGMALADLVVSP